MPVITSIDDLKALHRRRAPKMFFDEKRDAWMFGSPEVQIQAVGGLFMAGQRFSTPSGDLSSLRQVGSEALGNSEAVAWTLYRDYLLPFEVASLFLLVAMIGAVVLGRKTE